MDTSEGEIFNLRVAGSYSRNLKEPPNTILLTLAGAFFAGFASLLFAIVKINRVKILPDPSLFVSCKRHHLVQFRC